MTTETITPAAATKATFRTTLDAKKASSRLSDMLSSAPQAVRDTFRTGLRRSQAAYKAGLESAPVQFVRRFADKVLGLARFFGWVDTLGTVLTAGALRDRFTGGVRRLARLATSPLRFVGRLLGKALSTFGTGTKVSVFVAGSYGWAEDKVATGFAAVMGYLDTHENSRVMTGLRGFFQARVLGKVLRRVFPKMPTWLLLLIVVLVPTFGQRKGENLANLEIRALLRWAVAKGDARKAAKEAFLTLVETHEAILDGEPVVPAQPVEKAAEARHETVLARLTVPWRGMDKGAIIEVETWETKGKRCYRYDGTVYTADAPASHLEFGWVEEAPKPAPSAPGTGASNRSTARRSGAKSAKQPAKR